MYRRGVSWWLSKEEDEALASAAESYEAVDPWHGPIAKWCDARRRVEIAEVMAEALERPRSQHTAHDAHRVAVILSELGYERRRVRAGASRVAVWERYCVGKSAGRPWESGSTGGSPTEAATGASRRGRDAAPRRAARAGWPGAYAPSKCSTTSNR